MGRQGVAERRATVFAPLSDEGHGRFVAASVKQDIVRTGWADDTAGP